MTIADETRTLIQAALAGDPALASLSVSGFSPETLSVHIAPGRPVKSIGGFSYSPEPPFHRETLMELIIRMQRLRWQRAAPFVPEVMPPEQRDLQALHKKHGKATVGFECGPGWTDTFDAVFTWLNEIDLNRDWSPSQIKEKYGTLRFYWYGDLPDLGDEIIEAAEHLSGHLCEICGAPGVLRSDGGWWSTRCRDHRKGWQS
ncbi:hypothetical protein [Devosia riboflavina]|uniref:hypothetical protein n=1 Tax=Devosia riboflavina TaxID=46914 RepID=UPI0005578AD7|nr:hypothetical protein [Devosia riboflavina]